MDATEPTPLRGHSGRISAFSNRLACPLGFGILLTLGACDAPTHYENPFEPESGKTHSVACSPNCDGSLCGDDGCGGTCACSVGKVCNSSLECVAPGMCDQTCSGAGWECGELCGVECGPCATGSCFWNSCLVPPINVSCHDCPLQLVLLNKTTAAGKLTAVELAIDHLPGTKPKPRVADLRLYSSHAVTLVAATPGQALTDAGKRLYTDPYSGNPWQQRGDRSYQLLALAFGNTNEIAPGRLVTLTFALDEPGPVPFRLVGRAQTFAPLYADNALQSTPYDQPIVVTIDD